MTHSHLSDRNCILSSCFADSCSRDHWSISNVNWSILPCDRSWTLYSGIHCANAIACYSCLSTHWKWSYTIHDSVWRLVFSIFMPSLHRRNHFISRLSVDPIIVGTIAHFCLGDDESLRDCVSNTQLVSPYISGLYKTAPVYIISGMFLDNFPIKLLRLQPASRPSLFVWRTISLYCIQMRGLLNE